MASSKKPAEAMSVTKDYKYTQEISQMMFVFGEVQDPLSETVNLVEDIVRSQLVELIIQARGLAIRRGARYLSAEDLIFLIRHDRGKVNRLRTYLSWKDVRKHAKDSDNAAGGGGVEEAIEDGADDKLAAKAQKITIKLPWEITTLYSEVLRQSGREDEDEEDEDDIEAHEASIQRLKEADDATRQMTREEYQHYADCRQATFTYRKAKRFREFLNLPSHLDLRSNDDTVDIVGFLAFEMVRSLTLAGLTVKKSLEEAYHRDDYSSPVLGKRKANGVGGTDNMSPTTTQNVRVIVRLPYNRPANQEDQIIDPPKNGRNREPATAEGQTGKALPLILKSHCRIYCIGCMPDIKKICADCKIYPECRVLYLLMRLPVHLLDPQETQRHEALRDERQATASSSTLTLQSPLARNPTHLQSGSERRPSPPSSGEDEMDSDDDEMLKEEEAERVAEEQEALDKKLAELQKMITGDSLGLVSVGRKQVRRIGQQGGEYSRGRDDPNIPSETHHNYHKQRYNASLSSRSARLFTRDTFSYTRFIATISTAKISAVKKTYVTDQVVESSGFVPAQCFGPISSRTWARIGDISDTSLSASALDSALLSNIRGNGSKFRFGTSYRSGAPH
ncbi:protein spt3 [Lentinula edodes]|uniref:Protein spt3 n=1 Tax=Lentinula edodes TaxID=5353 RepID=A0A1Q3EB25_LENED|nr:protein spt3 [Lentinula edodes]